MTRKVALLVFNPFTNDSRVLKESISLSNNGYKVEVIAHLGKKVLALQKEEKFTVRRFGYLDRNVTKSMFGKSKAYFTYLAKSISYCKNFDILHCNDLNTLPIGFIIKKFFNKNIKIIYDAHEYETETNGLSGTKKILIKKLEQLLIPYANKIICVSDAIANEYVKLYNIPKPELVLNTPKYTDITKKDIFRKKLDISPNKTIFLYQGSLNRGRGVELIISTFKELDDNSVIIFMGYGELEKKVRTAAKRYTNIYYHEVVSPNVLLEYTSSADFGIATIEDTCLSYRYCLPNKMFEYIMAEVPIIVSNLPEMKKIVKEYNIGVFVKEHNKQDIKNALIEVKKLNNKALSVNIKKAKEVFNWEMQEKLLLKIYYDLDSRHKRISYE